MKQFIARCFLGLCGLGLCALLITAFEAAGLTLLGAIVMLLGMCAFMGILIWCVENV